MGHDIDTFSCWVDNNDLIPTETRVEQSDHTQFDLKPQSVIQCRPSQSAVVSLCPIPISESTTRPGACLLSFNTIKPVLIIVRNFQF